MVGVIRIDQSSGDRQQRCLVNILLDPSLSERLKYVQSSARWATGIYEQAHPTWIWEPANSTTDGIILSRLFILADANTFALIE
jgi:hypothetical protein